MAVIRWLHISDLHLNRRGVESRRIRNKLLEFLKQQEVSCKYIFVTGDLRYAPEGEFGENTVDYLTDIKDVLGVDISNIFIVPGNHDVIRDDKSRVDAIGKVLDKGYYNSKEGIIKDSELKGIFSGKAEFTEVMDEFYQSVPERSQRYCNALKPHFLVITDDFNIIHLDSTLTYLAGHEGDLLLCTEKMMDVLEKCDATKPKLVLSHYSFDYLSRDEQKAVEKLIRENGIGLWLSGHEHDLLIRVQRDCFYDIQSGNLNYEEGDIKSCVLIGELDTAALMGEIHGYEWDTDIGWKGIQSIDKNKRSSRYEINLNKVLVTSALSGEVKSGPYAFETYSTSAEGIPGMSFMESSQIGKKRVIDPDTEFEKSDANFDSDMFRVTVFPWNTDNGLSLLLGEPECEVYQGFLYLDSAFAPFMEMTVRHNRHYGLDHFEIENDTVRFDVNKMGDICSFITFQYNLSRFSDVDERLLHFKKIKELQAANSFFIKMRNHEEYNLQLDVIKEMKEWKDNVELTDYWIDQMKRISSIEGYFGIKFYLPTKATEDDYLAIDVLSDSIGGYANRTLPPIPMEHPGFTRSFELEEEEQIGEGDGLLWLRLFGYDFKPVAQYILPGRYVWKRKTKAWEAEKYRGGVPVRVEFEVSNDEDDYESAVLSKTVPFEAYQEDFCIDDIMELEGEDGDFFERYIKLTYDVQTNYKLFCDYRSVLSVLIDETGEGIDVDSEVFRNRTLGKIAINRITERIVSTGSRFLKGIIACVKYLGIDEHFSMEKYYEENIGFMWLTCMQVYTEEGHFPISVNSNRAEYDFQQIRNEVKSAGDNRFAELIDVVMEAIGKNAEEASSWYNMIRNYCYTVAIMQRDYYNLIEPVIKDEVKTMKDFIKRNPNTIHRGKYFDNYVTYLLENDKGNLHIFSVDDDVLSTFYEFKNEALKHLDFQMIGLQGSESESEK